MSTYEESAQALQPAPMQRKPRYLALMGALAAPVDTEAERLKTAVYCGIVERAPDDALDLLGAERLLPRYPSQDNDTYRAYLKKAFEIWRKSGTKKGLEDAFTAAFPGPTWVCKEFLFFPTDDLWNGSDFWSQFLMEADPSTPIEETVWGGGVWGGGTWGSSLTEDQIELFRKLLAQWKAAYSTAAGVRLVLETTTIVILPNPQ